MERFDYKKMGFIEMLKWVEENKDVLKKERPEELKNFMVILVDKKNRKQTNSARPIFRKLATGYVEFDNLPKGKTVKVDEEMELYKKLKAELGMD